MLLRMMKTHFIDGEATFYLAMIRSWVFNLLFSAFVAFSAVENGVTWVTFPVYLYTLAVSLTVAFTSMRRLLRSPFLMTMYILTNTVKAWLKERNNDLMGECMAFIDDAWGIENLVQVSIMSEKGMETLVYFAEKRDDQLVPDGIIGCVLKEDFPVIAYARKEEYENCRRPLAEVLKEVGKG